MKAFLWLLCLSVALLCSVPQAGEFKLYRDRELKKFIPTFQTLDVRMSDSASCRAKKCRAVVLMNSVRPKSSPQVTEKSTDPRFVPSYNPAQEACAFWGGALDTFFEEDRSEVSVCVFSDSSFIYSWDLVKKFNKGK